MANKNNRGAADGITRWWREDRYYIVIAHRDLFGAVIVDRQWGSRRSNRRGGKRDAFLSEADATVAIGRIASTRRRHGYNAVGGSDESEADDALTVCLSHDTTHQ